MQILVNTDNSIVGREGLVQYVEASVEAALNRFSSQITRVEAHLSDPAGGKAGGSKKCVLEARLAGRAPVAVSHEAATLNEAIDEATRKLLRLLESALGRLSDH